jgi:hypothetical protein
VCSQLRRTWGPAPPRVTSLWPCSATADRGTRGVVLRTEPGSLRGAAACTGNRESPKRQRTRGSPSHASRRVRRGALPWKGQQRISKLMVGWPVHYPEQQIWYCPVLIEGHTRPRIKPIFGMGPVDSLMNAMTFVRRFFEENFEILPGAKPPGTRRSRPAGPGKRATPRRKCGRGSPTSAPRPRSAGRPDCG